MGADGEGRIAPTGSTGGADLENESGATTSRRSRTGPVLGTLAGLIIIAGVVYYLAEHRPATDAALNSGSERGTQAPAVASNPRTTDNSEKSTSPTTLQQPPTSPQPPTSRQSRPAPPSEAQQSANATLSPSAETPAAPPEKTATAPAAASNAPAPSTQETEADSSASESAVPAEPAKAPQTSEQATGTQASTSAPTSMRDQEAALPDQAAATPKKENVLIVMRGPANIRSEPGKKGRVIGTAAKNATVKEIDRSGKWVQVETEAAIGWINAALLRSPENR